MVFGIMWEIYGKIGYFENLGICLVFFRLWLWLWKCDLYGLGIKLNLKSLNRLRFFIVIIFFVV